MAKGDSLKRYKIEQKALTRKKIQEVIKHLQTVENEKITVTKIAELSGITRATIYANYKDLLDDLGENSRNEKVSVTLTIKEKNKIIDKLKEENRELRDINYKLMDQVVALKIMLRNREVE